MDGVFGIRQSKTMPTLKAQIVWLPEALQDVQRLHEFLESKSQSAAKKAIRAILKAAKQLEAFPNLGHPMPDETGRRELFISFSAGAYVLRYKKDDKHNVVVIRVWHSRE